MPYHIASRLLDKNVIIDMAKKWIGIVNSHTFDMIS